MHMPVASMAAEAFPKIDIVTTLSLFRWLSGVAQLEYCYRRPYIVLSDSFWTPSSTPLACWRRCEESSKAHVLYTTRLLEAL